MHARTHACDEYNNVDDDEDDDDEDAADVSLYDESLSFGYPDSTTYLSSAGSRE